MGKRPTLAILVPAYNAAAFLPRMLASVAAQTVPFDEILVYDDCSTDDTATVAERFGARVMRGDVNRGCSYGKMLLAKRTRCDWVHFHDADDLLLPDFAARARTWMEADDADVVAFGCEERDWDTGALISVAIPEDAELKADPISYTIHYKFNAQSGLYRRDAFLAAGGFDLDPLVLYNEDQAMHARLARRGLRFRGDPTVLMINHSRPGSMSKANWAKCIAARYHVLRKTAEEATSPIYHRLLAEQLWLTAASAASTLDWETADKAAALAIRLEGPSSAPSGPLFKGLCHVSPRVALRAREMLIRLLRPNLRKANPMTQRDDYHV